MFVLHIKFRIIELCYGKIYNLIEIFIPLANNWKAPHKKPASDTVCMIYTLKRQWHLPCFVCMHYCVKRPKPSTQKQGK